MIVAAFTCYYCGATDGLTMLSNGREVCHPCYNQYAIGPCELGRKGWEPCTYCGRMASTYCTICDIRTCPKCFTNHREDWED